VAGATRVRRWAAGCWHGVAAHGSLGVLTGVLLASVTIPPVHTASIPLCLVHLVLGIAGPGCGMTRAFLFIGHGDLRSAVVLNPNSVVVFGLVVLLWVHGLLRVAGGWHLAVSLTARQRRLIYGGAGLATAAGWLYNLAWNPWL
jgi:Protein of unknown function (DUF2752)